MLFGTKSVKMLPKQIQEPLPVGKEGVGNLALSCTAKTLEARSYLMSFEGGWTSIIYDLIKKVAVIQIRSVVLAVPVQTVS